MKAASEEPTAASPGLSLHALQDLFENDPQKIGEFLNHVQKNMVNFQTVFAAATKDKDAAAIGELRHTMNVQLDLLGLNELLALLDQCQTALNDQSQADQLIKTQQRVESMVARVIESLAKVQEQLK